MEINHFNNPRYVHSWPLILFILCAYLSSIDSSFANGKAAAASESVPKRSTLDCSEYIGDPNDDSKLKVSVPEYEVFFLHQLSTNTTGNKLELFKKSLESTIDEIASSDHSAKFGFGTIGRVRDGMSDAVDGCQYIESGLTSDFNKVVSKLDSALDIKKYTSEACGSVMKPVMNVANDAMVGWSAVTGKPETLRVMILTSSSDYRKTNDKDKVLAKHASASLAQKNIVPVILTTEDVYSGYLLMHYQLSSPAGVIHKHKSDFSDFSDAVKSSLKDVICRRAAVEHEDEWAKKRESASNTKKIVLASSCAALAAVIATSAGAVFVSRRKKRTHFDLTVEGDAARNDSGFDRSDSLFDM